MRAKWRESGGTPQMGPPLERYLLIFSAVAQARLALGSKWPLTHLGVWFVCALLTPRTGTNAAGAARWSAAAAPECWHTRTAASVRPHTHLHKHNLAWVSQVQNICIHGRFCIGFTTYSVSSNRETWLSALTLRRPWIMLECFYGCIYGSVVVLAELSWLNIYIFPPPVLQNAAFWGWNWPMRPSSAEHTHADSLHMSVLISTCAW